MVNVISLLGALFSISAVAFYIIGCIGYNKNKNTYKSIPWLKSTKQIDLTSLLGGGIITVKGDYNAGLRGGVVKAKASAQGVSATTDFTFTFSTDDDGTKKCVDYGKSALGLLIAAGLLSLVCAIGNILLIGKGTMTMKVVVCVLSLLSLVAGIVGVSLFMSYCKSGIEDSMLGDATDIKLGYGTGSIIATAGYAAMIVVWLLSILNVMTPSVEVASI